MNGLIGAGLQLSFFTQICSNSLHLKFKMDFDQGSGVQFAGSFADD